MKKVWRHDVAVNFEGSSIEVCRPPAEIHDQSRRQPDALISAGPDPSTNKIYVVLREPDRSLIEELYRSLPQDVMILSIESGTWTSYVPLA